MLMLGFQNTTGCQGTADSVGSQFRALGDDLLGFRDDGVEVGLVAEALGVDLVDVFGAGGPGGEPAVRGDDLQPADRGVVARVPGSAWRRSARRPARKP